MPSFLERYATNKNLEEDGVWVDYADGLKVKLRRMNSVKSRETRRRLEKPYTKGFRGQDMPESLQEELLNKQLSEAIVVEWEGVPDPDNPEKMLPCTPENVFRMVTQFPDFRDDLLSASMERATFQAEQLKEAEKNSKNT
jgi:preprotein translocase subunit SecD